MVFIHNVYREEKNFWMIIERKLIIIILKNLDKIENYEKQCREKINHYKKNRKESDLNFKLACNSR